MATSTTDHVRIDTQPTQRTNTWRSILLLLSQKTESQSDFRHGNDDGQNNENNDDPRNMAHLSIRNGFGENGCEFKENAAALVENLDAGCDFEVFADGKVEWVEGWLGVPEEVWDVEDIGG